jgi:hypothetical protein
MVTYFLKTLSGLVLPKTRTTSPQKISEEAMWYQNRGYEVVVMMEREVPLGQLRLTLDSD